LIYAQKKILCLNQILLECSSIRTFLIVHLFEQSDIDIDNNLIQGQVFTIFVITVAAAEAAVGLAILLSLYRNRVTVDMESFNLLKW